MQVISKDDVWWTGMLNGVKGVFPSNYVQLRDDHRPPPPTSSHPSAGQGVTVLSKPLIAKVIASYARTKDTQLNLSPGDLVKVGILLIVTYIVALSTIIIHIYIHVLVLSEFASIMYYYTCKIIITLHIITMPFHITIILSRYNIEGLR